MSRNFLALLTLALAAPALAAQNPAEGRCATPDSIVIRGNKRLDPLTIRESSGLVPGLQLNFRLVQRAVKQLFATGEFDAVDLNCEVTPVGDRALLVIDVRERKTLQEFDLRGMHHVPEHTLRDHATLPLLKALDPALVAHAVYAIDSAYAKSGYYLAKVRAETTDVSENAVRLTFHIEEGRRLAVAGIDVEGNRHVKAADIVGAMKTKPEGFWFWRQGELDDQAFAADLADRVPGLYAKRGFIDFQVAKDTLLVNRDLGKALIKFSVNEGKQYKVGTFEVVGSRHFSSEDIRRYYPFEEQTRPLTSRLTDLLRRRTPLPTDVFDQAKWEDATNKVRTAYSNEGYIYASIRPVVERRVAPDSTPYVDLRWEVEEQTPAIINRIEIVGNDYTSEACIRDQLVILPGDVFNQDRIIKSWQSIGNLGFFEQPLPFPDTHRANEQGDVDVVFKVKEKRTGNVNFGASMGQGTGVGGFIGLDQPNLFGQCKKGSLQWQFGRYINDFNLTYSDPRIKESQISGSVSLYHTLARYYIADLGRSLRNGAQVQFGMPVPYDYWTRVFVSYGGESVSFGSSGLLGQVQSQYGNNSFRSSIGLTYTRDTRAGLPFPTQGASESVTGQFNGGPLGGTSSFQRYTTETSAFAPLAQFGGGNPGQQPVVLVAGLTTHAGAVFGNTGPFFFSQEFALGGVQFGERLRGYPEFSITPKGFVTGTDTYNAQRSSFGKAFFTTTAELGLRLNSSLYVNAFMDAGNLWQNAREVDPTRLFRGAGLGASTITPLGPLGIDYAYGFDRLNAAGSKAPKWQLHFRLGQLFY
jgi:outer membrane protein insertion porin family